MRLLPLRDRKNARLTCRSWYYQCSCSKIIEKEKFVFRKRTNTNGGDDCAKYFQIGLRKGCKTWRTYFEFHGLSLAQFPSTVWRSCGDKIQFLFLYNCDIDESTFADIIFYCPNLVRFRFENNFPALNPKSAQLGSVSKILFHYSNTTTPKIDRLIRRKIQRKKLISCEIYTAYNDLGVSEVMYRKIFKIYPCIRTFGQRGCPHRRSVSTMRYQLKYSLHPLSQWTCIPELKFKELRTMFNDYSINRAGFLDFISSQTDLEHFTLYIRPITLKKSYNCLSILFHALHNLPKLKELQFNVDIDADVISLTAENFGEFLLRSCNLGALVLQTVHLNLDFIMTDTEHFLPSVKYTRLKKLFLGVFIDERIAFEILNRCSTSLHFLRLDLPVNYRITQKIFEIHTDLQSLLVYNLELFLPHYNLSSSDQEGLPTEYSCNRLQSLKRLEIKHFITLPPRSDFNAFWTEFNSPNLRYFQFPCCFDCGTQLIAHEKLCQIFHETLYTLSRKAPLLEILSFHADIPFSAIELSLSCRQLKNLEVIFVSKGSLKDWVERNLAGVENLFMECSSLRWLAGEESSMYSYNHSSNELIEYSDNICLFDQKYNICGSGDIIYAVF